MSGLQVFSHSQFGQVRTINEGGKMLFCGADVARALSYKDTVNAIKQHCRGVVKRHVIDSMGRQQEASFIPESDVYRLAMRSNLPAAEEFERWVVEDVLPTIRKHGMYAADELLNNPDFAIQTFTALKQEREQRIALQAKIEEDRPKVLFADAVAASSSTILIGELAKLLRQNGVEVGQNRLFAIMREKGYLIRRAGADYNMPTQRSMELGLFEIKETVINCPDGSIRVSKTTKVTGKGQQYFIDLMLGKQLAVI